MQNRLNTYYQLEVATEFLEEAALLFGDYRPSLAGDESATQVAAEIRQMIDRLHQLQMS